MRESLGNLEKPKPSVKLAIEVVLMGAALWQLKRVLDRAGDKSDERPSYPRPLVEPLEDSNIYVYPSSLSPDGEPEGLTIGSVSGPEGPIAVSGAFDRESNFILEESSETDPTRLKILMNRLDSVWDKLEERSARFKSNSIS